MMCVTSFSLMLILCQVSPIIKPVGTSACPNHDIGCSRLGRLSQAANLTTTRDQIQSLLKVLMAGLNSSVATAN
ncbi:hypothetical protein GGR57DRAFT_442958 [Xylariaceae sp. FL1272]|nr:hypothetical protein GGR57DRAFT_442958 [Xylariaceae sp. FL1272]